MVCCGLLISLASIPIYSQTPGSSQREDSCRKFVQQFYDWYLPKARPAKVRASDLVLKEKSSVLSRELARRLKQDSDAQDKADGELVGLDFDPFLNTQDPGFEKCVAGNAVCQTASCRVKVTCNFPGQHADKSELTPELQFTNGQWVFVNFHYTVDGKAYDLLTMLKQLSADRKPKSK